MREELAPLYHNLGRQLPDAQKPSIRVFETCLRTEDNKEGSTDEEIQRIVLRWKRFSFLRGLYVDENISQEFDRFRTALASDLTPEERATMVLPGFNSGSIETSHVNRMKFMQNNRFAGDFKARFHRILCLHSMAVIGLHFAKISTAEPESEQEGHDVAEMIDHLWIKEDVLAGGKKTEFDLNTQLDGVEVFDFLYMFLLKKILPYYNLASWIGNDAGQYPFEWRVTGLPNEPELLEWYSFLCHCRKVLQPDDLVDLIENGAWRGRSSGPQNKSMYLRVRGMFEQGDQNELGFDWNTDFERSSIVRALCATLEGVLMGPEDPCGWDHLRLRLGSPFSENSVYGYQNEIDEMNEERKRKERWEEENEVWSNNGANISMPR